MQRLNEIFVAVCCATALAIVTSLSVSILRDERMRSARLIETSERILKAEADYMARHVELTQADAAAIQRRVRLAGSQTRDGF